MRFVATIFLVLAFTTFKAMLLEETQPEALTFPAFGGIDVIELVDPGSCGGFFDCTEFLAKVFLNIGIAIIDALIILVNIIRYAADLVIFVGSVSIAGFEGAPSWLNVIIIGVQAAGLAISIYLLIRSGRDE